MRMLKRPALLSALFGKTANARTAAHSRHLDILITRPGHPSHHFRIDLDGLRRLGRVNTN